MRNAPPLRYIGVDQVHRDERMRRRVLRHYWDHLGWRVRVRLYRLCGHSLVMAMVRATF